MVGATMNLISETYHSCEGITYLCVVLDYWIITQEKKLFFFQKKKKKVLGSFSVEDQ